MLCALKYTCSLLRRFHNAGCCSNTYNIRYLNSTCDMRRSTIFALSTSPGISAVAVIRVSGPNASNVLYKMGNFKTLPLPRTAILRKIKDPDTKELLDNVLLLWFPSPHSFTGEDICELHVHGGRAVVKSVIRGIEKLPEFRHADPGEFTKRAFINGKLDLTEVEGLRDLLHAETETQQQQALHQMGGALFTLYNGWMNVVKKCLANVEAYIDFSEDQNLESNILEKVARDVQEIHKEIKKHLNDDYKGERLRSGIFTALIGKPNVGKSSLLNAICRRDVAIVSATAGTTRDIVESSINIGGYLVHLSDTAGMHESQNNIEQEGIKRAYKRSAEADIWLFIIEAMTAVNAFNSCEIPENRVIQYFVEKEVGSELLSNVQIINELPCNTANFANNNKKKVHVLLIFNKTDLLTAQEISRIKCLAFKYEFMNVLSCCSGIGLDSLMERFLLKIKELCDYSVGKEPVITQERHRKCIESCNLFLEQFYQYFRLDIVLAAEKLRNATTELGKLTGKITTEDILDIIFKDFCIGK